MNNFQKPGGWIPNRESIAEQQVNTALNILNNLAPFILAPHREFPNLPKELDGGTECAAVTTFVKVCARLDAMLDSMAASGGGRRDRLTDFTRALTGAYYFVPASEALAMFAAEPGSQT